jgi:hypothetical protein
MHASPEEGLPEDSIAITFQMRAVPKTLSTFECEPLLKRNSLSLRSLPTTRLSDR